MYLCNRKLCSISLSLLSLETGLYWSCFLLLTVFPYISLFFKQEMELSLVGLQNAGKTSLVNAVAVSEHILCYSFCYLWVVFSWYLSFYVCQTGGYTEDMIPTVGIFSLNKFWIKFSIILAIYLTKWLLILWNQVGFNMRKVTKGNVTIKLWDLGGQRRFRTMWERYCRGVSAIL